MGALSCNSLTVNGSSITSAPTYVLSITPGTASASKALVLNTSSSVSGINSLSASSLTGTLQTGAQPYITSLGTLSSLTISGNLTFSGASRSLTGLNTLTVNSNASVALVLDSLNAISAIGQMGTMINTTVDVGPTSTMDKYLITLKNSSGADAVLQGIAMLSSSIANTSGYTPGCSITFQRSTAGGSAAHELLFNIKTGAH
ncbi:unnamed protein product [Phytophthora lilii]|uniref:Unnamed protein product n=1 Tax=Phytophthora lilii TaxID=2077276 RepID=A0A9W6TID7_9STRA|nr:unnamed protein product [Phytophthora lilii]